MAFNGFTWAEENMLLKLLALLMFPAAFCYILYVAKSLLAMKLRQATLTLCLVKAESKSCVVSFTLQGHVMSKLKIP